MGTERKSYWRASIICIRHTLDCKPGPLCERIVWIYFGPGNSSLTWAANPKSKQITTNSKLPKRTPNDRGKWSKHKNQWNISDREALSRRTSRILPSKTMAKSVLPVVLEQNSAMPFHTEASGLDCTTHGSETFSTNKSGEATMSLWLLFKAPVCA